MSVTASDVAKWMLDEFERQGGYLAQSDAVSGIEQAFGRDFLRENAVGNDAIHPDVLGAFRRLTTKTVVWDRSELAWRRRIASDGEGRRSE